MICSNGDLFFPVPGFALQHQLEHHHHHHHRQRCIKDTADTNTSPQPRPSLVKRNKAEVTTIHQQPCRPWQTVGESMGLQEELQHLSFHLRSHLQHNNLQNFTQTLMQIQIHPKLNRHLTTFEKFVRKSPIISSLFLSSLFFFFTYNWRPILKQ